MDIERFVGVLNRQAQAYISNALKNIDIGYSECVFLSNLYGNEGINQEELSSILFTDKRSKRLYLTDKGRNCKE